ncbi:hypothetical protein VCHENC02_4564, partial [Vibrio harveyi]
SDHDYANSRMADYLDCYLGSN